MAQTTDGFARARARIEVSDDGVTWVAGDGTITTMDVSGGEQHTGQTNTLAGRAPVVTYSNKYTATEITVESLYTEEATEWFEVVYDRYQNDEMTIYMRFAPRGDEVGANLFTCADDSDTAIPVPITSCLPPSADANSGEAAMFSFGIITPKLAKSAVTT